VTRIEVTPEIKLRFVCPTTSKAVEFHLARDTNTFKKLWTKDLRRICPHCGARHRFAFKDGYALGAIAVEEEGGQRGQLHAVAVQD
jgi:hypothetical protein